jgi:lipopolysaccharide transport system permease protein
MPSNEAPFVETVIEAEQGPVNPVRDLLRYRDLLYFLAQRDILVRYKQAVFGVLWAVIRPLLVMLVFSFIFGVVAGLKSQNVPYFLFVLAGMLPWQLFSGSITDAGNSIISDARLISKVYFPRILIPLSAIAVNLLDFLISFGLLLILMLFSRTTPGREILLLPLVLLWCVLLSAGCGAWLAALNVKYRDFRHLIPFVTQFGLYVSPVGFDSAVIPDRWRYVFALNPMAGVIDSFRYVLFGVSSPFLLGDVLIGLVVSAILLAGGLRYFRATERTFADVI